jgi:hypothetical protein
MDKFRYIVSTIVYLISGFIFGMGVFDNDPVIKIVCLVALAMTTMLFVYNTWRYLFRD